MMSWHIHWLSPKILFELTSFNSSGTNFLQVDARKICDWLLEEICAKYPHPWCFQFDDYLWVDELYTVSFFVDVCTNMLFCSWWVYILGLGDVSVVVLSLSTWAGTCHMVYDSVYLFKHISFWWVVQHTIVGKMWPLEGFFWQRRGTHYVSEILRQRNTYHHGMACHGHWRRGGIGSAGRICAWCGSGAKVCAINFFFLCKLVNEAWIGIWTISFNLRCHIRRWWSGNAQSWPGKTWKITKCQALHFLETTQTIPPQIERFWIWVNCCILFGTKRNLWRSVSLQEAEEDMGKHRVYFVLFYAWNTICFQNSNKLWFPGKRNGRFAHILASCWLVGPAFALPVEFFVYSSATLGAWKQVSNARHKFL